MANYNDTEKTISGIQPSKKKKYYDITTSEVKNFIQKRFTDVDNALVAEGKMNEEDKIKIDLISVDVESKYVPFLLILPDKVLNQRRNDNRPEIFTPKNEGCRLIDGYYYLIRNFMYSEEDRKAMHSNAWKDSMGIRTCRTVNLLKQLSTPSLVESDDGSGKKVMVLLDPLNVFEYMLMYYDKKRNFTITVKDLTKFDEHNYGYEVLREIRTPKPDKNLEKEILKYFRSKK